MVFPFSEAAHICLCFVQEEEDHSVLKITEDVFCNILLCLVSRYKAAVPHVSKTKDVYNVKEQPHVSMEPAHNITYTYKNSSLELMQYSYRLIACNQRVNITMKVSELIA